MQNYPSLSVVSSFDKRNYFLFLQKERDGDFWG